MANISKNTELEKKIRRYLRQAREKLYCDLAGTREAIKLIATEKTRCFIETMDRGLNREEREFLRELIVASMHQSFCYGYSIGKIEGNSNIKVSI